MKKLFFLCLITSIFAPVCFSQNMFVLGGEYSLTNPQYWGLGLGFNLKVYKEYFQNDFSVNFGGIRVNDPAENMWAHNTKDAAEQKFLFYLKDNIYYSHDWKWVGIRAGVFVLIGLFDIYDNHSAADLLFNGGGFAGICLLPKSLFSLTIDVCPGYAIAFYAREKEAGIKAGGFSLPLAVGVRFNLDKL